MKTHLLTLFWIQFIMAMITGFAIDDKTSVIVIAWASLNIYGMLYYSIHTIIKTH